LLIPNPRDLAGFGTAVRRVLGDDEFAAAVGRAARERVRMDFLDSSQLIRHWDLVVALQSPD
jgi:hypothetical protein